MHLFLSLVLLLSLSVSSLAIPTPIRHPHLPTDKSFRIARVKRSDFVAHGPAALRKAYRKYGVAPHNFDDLGLSDFAPLNANLAGVSSNQNTAESDQTGAVTATSVQNDVEFVSPVTIGGQNITLNFDTGSADLWVMNTYLPDSITSGRTVYDPQKSRTYKATKGTFAISYGDSSSASGGLAQDTVSIGGATVQNQVFGIPTKVANTFIEDTHSNGLVGLGFSKMNTFKPGPHKTFFDNIAADLDEPVLTARLLSSGVGEYEFGTIDKSKYQGTLVNVSVDASNGYWEFDAAQFRVGGEKTWHEITDTPTAIADTGTSLMLVAAEVARAYYKDVNGSMYAGNVGGYIYPCDAELPSLSVAIGGEFQATIPGSLINYSQIGTNTTTGETLCYGGVQSNSGSKLQIFGDVFLKALFVVFDQRGPSLGFAAPA
ncbi:aspergillopepsin A-like aspartic endopeptidase [Penicillium capsulatum]|uniref:penicillopepsin n=1 Tax=Penicillium capsulatum TaxID=69766 RepID=A0A9W9I599_9EURO|nr:aspergillopepsin A-like aspartic endopeptidase [Penicillium capsulatum]KAJ6108900.1 aspergillopepsin A-like aspartic endopeptidase [Penicillium capsulatum]